MTGGTDVFDMMIKTGLWSLPPSWFVTLRVMSRSMSSVAIAMSGVLSAFPSSCMKCGRILRVFNDN